jgi:hypothetical protein
MAREDEAAGLGIEDSRPAEDRMRYCEMCGVSGMSIEVREIWIDGKFFGTFCGRCEMRRTSPPGRGKDDAGILGGVRALFVRSREGLTQTAKRTPPIK